MVLNKKEKMSLEKKLINPDKKSICPRCGNEIILIEIGNSTLIKCKTDNCISGGVRGI